MCFIDNTMHDGTVQIFSIISREYICMKDYDDKGTL